MLVTRWPNWCERTGSIGFSLMCPIHRFQTWSVVEQYAFAESLASAFEPKNAHCGPCH